MTMVLQASDGTAVDNANAYAAVAAVRAFALDRGVDLIATSNAAVEVAVIKATDFLDANYSFVGYQLYRTQGTQWPRHNVGTFLHGLPPALLKATCLLAMKVLAGTVLSPAPTADPSGLIVSEATDKVGPIEKTRKYTVAPGGMSASAIRPVYPDVDLALKQAGLLATVSGGRVVRG